ncbi:MAG: hypothetical protein ABI609_08435 [Acidobacteriota bacterium]
MKRSLVLAVVLLFATLIPVSAHPTDVTVGPIRLQLGMSPDEATHALPAGYRLDHRKYFSVTGEAGHGGMYAQVYGPQDSVNAVLWMTFEHGRMTRAVRIVDRVDYKTESAPVLTEAVVKALATWPQDEPIRSEAKTFGEGQDRLLELRFIQGERKLILTESARLVQLVENFGREDVQAAETLSQAH